MPTSSTSAGPSPGAAAAAVAGRRRPCAAHRRERALQERLTPRRQVRAFLGLGSNLGDRLAYLRGGVHCLPDVVAVSPLYETDPIGGPPGQGAHLNCVVELWTVRTPRELMVAAQAAEAAAGRARVERWGPRTLDVDVLLVGDEKVDEPDLTVPHPRMWSRGFVLVPLGDLAPELVLGSPHHQACQRGTCCRYALSSTNGTRAGAGTSVRHSVTLELVESPSAWRATLDACRSKGQRVGLVPTMGALHAGHLSLIRRAAADCDLVTVTDYVNPLQFGPAEDLAAYPRDRDGDCRLAGGVGADVMFAPSTEELWPVWPRTSVRVEGIGDLMEGASRPGHFAGVATVVAKLLFLAGPCWSYFGEKDYQQLAVIRRLVADLSIPVEVIGCPTVRDPDGLALSSRTAYRTPEERASAPQLYSALLAGTRAIEDDGVDVPALVVRGPWPTPLGREPRFDLDYAEVADPDDLTRPKRVQGEVRLLIAARLGRARLIDNIAATSPSSTEGGTA